MEFVRRLARHPVIRQQGKFLAVGVICTFLDFGIFNALAYGADLNKIASNTVSFVITVAVSFTLNRLWTFGLEGKVDWAREAIPFLVVSSIGLGLQNVAIWAAGRYLSAGILVINAAKVAGVGTIWFVKFFVYRKWVFVDRRPAGTADAAALAAEGL